MTIGRDESMPETLQGHRGTENWMDEGWWVEDRDFLYPFYHIHGSMVNYPKIWNERKLLLEIHLFFHFMIMDLEGSGYLWNTFYSRTPNPWSWLVQVGGWFPSEFSMSTTGNLPYFEALIIQLQVTNTPGTYGGIHWFHLWQILLFMLQRKIWPLTSQLRLVVNILLLDKEFLDHVWWLLNQQVTRDLCRDSQTCGRLGRFSLKLYSRDRVMKISSNLWGPWIMKLNRLCIIYVLLEDDFKVNINHLIPC